MQGMVHTGLRVRVEWGQPGGKEEHKGVVSLTDKFWASIHLFFHHTTLSSLL